MLKASFQSSLAGGGSWRKGLAGGLFLLIALDAAIAAGPATAVLGTRAGSLVQRAERALLAGGEPLDGLRADLVEGAAQLEAAHVDSLASDLRYHAARVLVRLGRAPEAEQQLGLAIADALKAKDRVRDLHARLFLADARANKDPATTLTAIEEALGELHRLRHDGMLGEAYATQAHALMELGQFPDGLIAARRAVAHHRIAGNVHEELLAMGQASQAMRFTGRHPEARALTDSLIDIARRTRDGLALSRGLLESASLYRTRHQFDEALAAVNEALPEDRRRGDASSVRGALTFRARIYASMGRPEASAADLDTLLATPEVQRSLTLLARVAAMQAAVLVELGQAARADALLSGIARRYERFRAGLEAEDDQAGTSEHSTQVYMAWTRVKLAMGQPEMAWQVAERGHGAAFESRLGGASVPDLAALQARLRQSHAALIEFDFPDPSVGSALVVTAGHVSGYPIRTNIAIHDITAVMDALSTASSAPAADSAALRISQALLSDAWPVLGSDVERLYIVPPARLESLPFEALPSPSPDGPARIGDRFPISYVASAGVLMALDRLPVPGSGLTIVADPSIDSRQRAIASLDPALRGAILRPLPGAREEAKRLAEAGSTVLMGRDATVARLTRARPAAVLHFATHAYEDPSSPTRGGLVLSGSEPLLSPARVESLGVAADLVTLSGCSTLGSTAYSGEGTFGLARAFLVSGSRTVISTRWNVSDRAAARFMQEFYAGLRSGANRDASLAGARKRLLSEGFPPRDCWAFMVLGVGDRPVAQWATPARGSRDTSSK